ncbi:MAG: serine/threonine protein kinase [Vulcanimicrobiota bacterium]
MPQSKTESFYELTPATIHRAFESAGLELEPTITFLNSLENRVVRVQDLDGERWVGKFYRPGRWTKAALLEEHDFLQELLDEGLPVVAPERLDSGSTLGCIEGIWFCLFPYHVGRPCDEVDPPLAYQVGHLVGRLHRTGLGGRFRHRPKLGPQYWAGEALQTLEREKVVPDTLWPRYQRTVQQLLQRVEKAFAQAPNLRIHGDLHKGNLLTSSLGLKIVDLDDCGMGPAVQDLWLLVSGRDPEAVDLRELMLEGYQSVHPFDRKQLALIEPLRALKFVHYAAWLARRRNDPAFQRRFSDVESHAFWRRELDELEQQVRYLSESY